MTNAGLCHHGNGGDGLNAFDQFRIGHAGDAALAANVGRNSLKGHDCARTGILCDAGLFGGDDVHDHAAFQHFGETPLYEGGTG